MSKIHLLRLRIKCRPYHPTPSQILLIGLPSFRWIHFNASVCVPRIMSALARIDRAQERQVAEVVLRGAFDSLAVTRSSAPTPTASPPSLPDLVKVSIDHLTSLPSAAAHK